MSRADTVPLFFPAIMALMCAIALVRRICIAAVHSYRGINLWKYQFNDDVAFDCESISKTAPTEIWELLVRECWLTIQ